MRNSLIYSDESLVFRIVARQPSDGDRLFEARSCNATPGRGTLGSGVLTLSLTWGLNQTPLTGEREVRPRSSRKEMLVRHTTQHARARIIYDSHDTYLRLTNEVTC